MPTCQLKQLVTFLRILQKLSTEPDIVDTTELAMEPLEAPVLASIITSLVGCSIIAVFGT